MVDSCPSKAEQKGVPLTAVRNTRLLTFLVTVHFIWPVERSLIVQAINQAKCHCCYVEFVKLSTCKVVCLSVYNKGIHA